MKHINIKIKLSILVSIMILGIATTAYLSLSQLKSQKDESLKTLETTIRTEYDNKIKEQVLNAHSMLNSVYNKYQTEEYTMAQAKKAGADILRDLTYGNDGYFWADAYDGTNVVMQGTETEGTNRMGLTDVDGFKMVEAIISVGKSGGGYTDYYYTKPGETEHSPKRSYSLAFEPFEWVIGTGNYVDYIDHYISEQSKIMEDSANKALLELFIFLIFIVLIISAFGIFIAYSIINPIKKVLNITEKLSAGNLDVKVDIKSKDEIGQVAVSLKSLVSRLKVYINYINEISQLLKQLGQGDLNLHFTYKYDGDFAVIKDSLESASSMLNHTLLKFSAATEQVAEGSEQVSAGAQVLASGAAEQASSIEEQMCIRDSGTAL